MATPLADAYRHAAVRILERTLAERGAFAKLEHLTDRIGHRLSGSKQLEQAVAWAVRSMTEDGHANVRAEKVMVPHWVRGEESAAIIAPIERKLHMLGLGGSVGTPKKGLTAEVVVVHSYEELEALGAAVEGKLVLFQNPMPPFGTPPGGSGYGKHVTFRNRGAQRAAKQGALGVLVRSVTARSLRSPHTGMTRYEDGGRKIPAAAISAEDADLIERLSKHGDKVRVRLSMAAKTLPDAESANVIGELVGREQPDEVVLIGAHLDSWDVGQGAHDDGAGVVMVMEALTLLRKLGLTPRRTIRVVLFTNEENGVRGANAYRDGHQLELAKHVAAIEADSGGFKPETIGFLGAPEALTILRDIVTLLAPLGVHVEASDGAGADIEQLEGGIPLLGVEPEGSQYFDYHHSEADTLDKVNPEHLQMNTASMAILAYVLAEMPVPLPRTAAVVAAP